MERQMRQMANSSNDRAEAAAADLRGALELIGVEVPALVALPPTRHTQEPHVILGSVHADLAVVIARAIRRGCER